jgi:hypothetical protein
MALLKDQEMYFCAKRPDMWEWWKHCNLKDDEIENLDEKIEENRQAILYTIDILLGNEIDNQDTKIQDMSNRQIELIFT